VKRLVANSRWIFFLLLVGAALGLSGCASPESDNYSERPWNAPQGWETGLPSGLTDQRR
jgi:hypothetical protein